MSTPPRFLEELLDHVVDHLHNERHNLKNCCLVSKSWVPRTRKHLFATISLHHEGDLQSWKNVFPDPSISPAHYTKTLVIGCPQSVTAGDVEEGGWLSAFSRVVRLAMYIPSMDRRVISLVPFHGLSPVIKSLRIYLTTFPSSPIFNLICSFSPLENLHVEVREALADHVDSCDGQQPPVRNTKPIRTHQVLEARGDRTVEPAHPSTAITPKRSPLPELVFNAYRRKNCFDGDGTGGEVSFNP